MLQAQASVPTSKTSQIELHEASPHVVDGQQKVPAVRQLVDIYRPRLSGLATLTFYLLVLLLVLSAWQPRYERTLTAESGAGYALGIVGGVMMLLLLLYPLRKRARFMRNWGAVKHWFRLHMLFGVLGPACILLHCGFHLGSLNSNVALICMLVVATSGLAGRYFYSKIHNGLYGQRATLAQLEQESEVLRTSLTWKLRFAPEVLKRLDAFDKYVRDLPTGAIAGSIRHLLIGVQTWWTALKINLILRRSSRNLAYVTDLGPENCRRLRRDLYQHARARLASIRRVSELQFYERLFSFWHILHFPLFVMLVLSGVVHVIAVHMY